MQKPALISDGPGAPPPMKKGMPTNVPLASQEGKKGVVQYALYVSPRRKGAWEGGCRQESMPSIEENAHPSNPRLT